MAPKIVGGPGGSGPRVPLDPLEQEFTDRMASMLRLLVADLDEDTLINAIMALDPDNLTMALAEITTGNLQTYIEDLLRALFTSNGEKEAAKQTRQRPLVARPTYVDEGVMMPSGIIIPADMAPPGTVGLTLTPLQRITLNFIDPKAVDYARTRSARLVTDIDEANRLALRRQIGDAVTQGTAPRDLARSLRQTVGLHTRWANAVSRYDSETMTDLVRQGMTPTAARARADVLTKRYRDRLIRRRAEMIARTEIQTVQNMARLAAWDASVKTGMTDPSSRKVWSTSYDNSTLGKPCEICREQKARGPIQWNAAFPMGVFMPPAHPHCRCTAVLLPPSRGLTGLPSQDLDSWIAQLDELDAEQAEVSA